VEAQPALAAVVVEERDRRNAVLGVADQALHQDAPARAGAEDDGPAGGVGVHGTLRAPRSDEEAGGEHPRHREGQAREGHAAGQVDDTDDEHEHAEDDTRDDGRPGQVAGLLERPQLVTHRIWSEDPADEEVNEDGDTGPHEQGRPVLVGDVEVEPQPRGDHEAADPDERVEGTPDETGVQPGRRIGHERTNPIDVAAVTRCSMITTVTNLGCWNGYGLVRLQARRSPAGYCSTTCQRSLEYRSTTVSRTGSILVVCTGNVCRSPYLERRLRHELAGTGIAVESAGTKALAGLEMDDGTRERLDAAGIDARGFPRPDNSQPTWCPAPISCWPLHASTGLRSPSCTLPRCVGSSP
jgi:hypothetical protein